MGHENYTYIAFHALFVLEELVADVVCTPWFATDTGGQLCYLQVGETLHFVSSGGANVRTKYAHDYGPGRNEEKYNMICAIIRILHSVGKSALLL